MDRGLVFAWLALDILFSAGGFKGCFSGLFEVCFLWVDLDVFLSMCVFAQSVSRVLIQ